MEFTELTVNVTGLHIRATSCYS